MNGREVRMTSMANRFSSRCYARSVGNQQPIGHMVLGPRTPTLARVPLCPCPHRVQLSLKMGQTWATWGGSWLSI